MGVGHVEFGGKGVRGLGRRIESDGFPLASIRIDRGRKRTECIGGRSSRRIGVGIGGSRGCDTPQLILFEFRWLRERFEVGVLEASPGEEDAERARELRLARFARSAARRADAERGMLSGGVLGKEAA